jgi:aryl-phospho-beta-D-glucosidase BglC (GH1 family)
MKTTRLSVFVLTISVAIAGLAKADDTEPSWVTGGDDKMLAAKGTDLRDHHGDGNVVILRGVNLGGWLEWQDWMCPMDSSGKLKDSNPGHNGYDFVLRDMLTKRFGEQTANDLIGAYEDSWITTRDLDNIKALGMNVVRLTFGYDTLLHDDGTWRDDAFTRMDWLVQKAWDRGIYTIIDYHAFLPASAKQDGSAASYWNNPVQKNETVQIWTHIADHYKGNPAVAMYDLLNEPNNSAPSGKPEPSAETICDLYDRIYTAIRTVDQNHVIAMEGLWDWKALRDPSEAGYRNVVYSFHWYHFGQKGVDDNNAATDDDINHITQMRESWTLPTFIGEFNLFGDAEAWRYALRKYHDAGLSWAMWTYKNKASDTNSWGVYTTLPGKAPPVPNLSTDSAADIRSKWKAWETSDDTFALNPMLGPVLTAQQNSP